MTPHTIFHPFPIPAAERPAALNDPFCCEGTPPVCRKVYEALLKSVRPLPRTFWDELERGKMLGVLIVENEQGETGYLAAFSGQIGGRYDWDGFVPPVFDYLDEYGYFKTHEREITAINHQVQELVLSPELADAKQQLRNTQQQAEQQVAQMKEENRKRKEERDRKRLLINAECFGSAECKVQSAELPSGDGRDGISPNSELCTLHSALLKESQFWKAELHRTKKRWAAAVAEKQQAVKQIENQIEELKALRHTKSDSLQRWLFSHFQMRNIQGDTSDLIPVFHRWNAQLPPSGAGECCAPKLFQYAFTHALRPLAIAEYWYGRSPEGEIRHHGVQYPACRGKCLPILTWQIGSPSPTLPQVGRETKQRKTFLRQLVHIQSSLPTWGRDGEGLLGEGTGFLLYESPTFCVVRKPAGLLSVPGKEGQPSVISLLERHYKFTGKEPLCVHRLDMHTSGLLLVALNKETQRRLQALFAERRIKKTYIALLDGDLTAKGFPTEGVISLPLLPDFNDRPRQTVNHQQGQEAITHYRILEVKDGLTRIEFHPQTGRTHQLRVHSAHPEGLATPIVGDPLYGTNRTPSPRMMLHAAELTLPDNEGWPETHFQWELELSPYNS